MIMKNKKNIEKKVERTKFTARRICAVVALAVSVMLAGASLWCFSLSHQTEEEPSCPEKYDDCINFLYSHSNLKESDLKFVGNVWPQEYYQINYKEKFVIYFRPSGNDTVCYKKVIKENKELDHDVIDFKDSNQSEKFKKWSLPSFNDVELEPSYEQIISSSNCSDERKNLSRLYNALVGNTKGFVVVGKLDGKWKCFHCDDFPVSYIDTVKIKEAAHSFIEKGNEQRIELGSLIRHALITVDKPQLAYYNIRKDSVYVDSRRLSKNDESQKVTGTPTIGNLISISNNRTVYASSIYSQNVLWTSLNEEEYQQLCNKIKWNEDPENNSSFWWIILAILSFSFLVFGIVLFFLPTRKKNEIEEPEKKKDNGFWERFKRNVKCSKDNYGDENGDKKGENRNVVPLTIVNTSFHEGMSITEILSQYDKLYGSKTLQLYDDVLIKKKEQESQGGNKGGSVSIPSPKVENPFNENMSISEILSQYDKLFSTDVSRQFSSYVTKKTYDDLQKESNDLRQKNTDLLTSKSDLEKEISELKEKRDKWLNQRKQITESKDLQALHAALVPIGYTKLSSLVETSVKDAETRVKEDYRKKSEHLAELTDKANSWDELMSVTKEDVLLKKWDKLREENVKLPIIHTVSWAYNEALSAVDKKKVIPSDLIYKYLVVTFKIVSDDYKLSDTYKRIIAMAANWQKNEKKVQSINNFAHDSVVSKVITSQDWKYWDRLAMMVRSLDLVHNLLLMTEDSGYASFNRDIRPVLAQVTSDFSQLYLFRYYVRDLKASYGYQQFDSDLEAVRKTFSTVNGDYALDCSLDSYAETVKSLSTAYNSVKGTQAFSSQMWNLLVKDFITNAPSNTDQAWFFSRVVAIAYHASDFIAGLNGRDSIFLYNQRYVMSGLNRSSLENDLVRFKYNDYQYSNDYTNRVYEWLKSMGVEHLPALVDNKLIMP